MSLTVYDLIVHILTVISKIILQKKTKQNKPKNKPVKKIWKRLSIIHFTFSLPPTPPFFTESESLKKPYSAFLYKFLYEA